MASEWYFQALGETVGPVSGSELKQRADNGTIADDTLIRKGRDGKWVVARRVKGLFHAPNANPPKQEYVSGPPLLPAFEAVSPMTSDTESGNKRSYWVVILSSASGLLLVVLAVGAWVFYQTKDARAARSFEEFAVPMVAEYEDFFVDGYRLEEPIRQGKGTSLINCDFLPEISDVPFFSPGTDAGRRSGATPCYAVFTAGCNYHQ